MDYNHIKNFLDKFKKIIYEKEELRDLVIKTISEEISHPIENDSLKIKGGCIYVKGSPMLRSEILMHKKEILNKLESLFPNIHFFDIK
ncbi:MAG: hypothetical protein JJE53_00220 [Candidatus Pacebacteria bacterium]|nr:hypothetical protein [Candidatus Paceibacterota bacterium]